MASCLLSQAYGKHPQRWRGGTTEATIKPAATNTLPRCLAKPRCFFWRKQGIVPHRKETNMNNPTQTEPQNNTVAPGRLRLHSISSTSIKQLDAEKERLQRTFWLCGQIQKWCLYVFPLVLVLMIYLVITHTVQSNGTHHGFLRRVGAGCHAATLEGNPQRNQGARHQTT